MDVRSESKISSLPTENLNQWHDSQIDESTIKINSTIDSNYPKLVSSSESIDYDNHRKIIENSSITDEIDNCSGPASFSSDEQAIRERQSCDYSIRITLEMAKHGLAPRKIRILANGIYDLFHIGHAQQLLKAKNVFSNVYLIVGIYSDQTTSDENAQTVMDEIERYESVRHCRYVDEIIRNLPRKLDEAFLNEHKIDFVIGDLFLDKSNDEDFTHQVKERSVIDKTRRSEGISTSDIISRLLRDYDLYVRRNLARGYSPRDLNVGFLKTKQIQLQTKFEKLKKFCIDDDQQKLFFEHWENRSKELIHNFIGLFATRSVVDLIQRTFSMSEDENSRSENDDENF